MAILPQIPQVQTASRTDNQAQQNIISALRHIFTNPLATVSYLKSVSLANGSTTIAHKLGTTAQGYLITKVNGAATVYCSAIDDTSLTLVSNAAVTADIIVF